MNIVGFVTVCIISGILLVFGWGILRTNIAYEGEGMFEWVVALIMIICGLWLAWCAYYYAPFDIGFANYIHKLRNPK